MFRSTSTYHYSRFFLELSKIIVNLMLCCRFKPKASMVATDLGQVSGVIKTLDPIEGEESRWGQPPACPDVLVFLFVHFVLSYGSIKTLANVE